MKCWKCGQEAGEGAKFCAACGADLSQPETAPEAPKAPGGAPNVDGGLVLKIFAGVFAVVFAIFVLLGVRDLLDGIVSVLDLLFLGHVGVNVNGFLAWLIGSVAVNILVLLSNVWMLAAMLLLVLKRTPENSDGLLTLAIGGVAVRGVVEVIALMVNIIVMPILLHGFWRFRVGWAIGGILLRLLVAAAAAGGAYLIIRLLIGEDPLAGKDFNTLLEEGKAAAANLFQSVTAAVEKARADREATRAAQTQTSAAAPVAPAAVGGATPPANYGGAHHMPTNRGLLVYILLCIVTCGIYGWYFIYAIARDMNIVCEGDGKRTPGLLQFILLNLITCGIYSWVWYYGLGNRMAANAPRYGLNFQENGTTILLWMLIGALLCGIGPLVALHILLRNANTLCGAYNVRNGV